MTTLFWILFGLLFYTYLGYGAIGWVLLRFKKKGPNPMEVSGDALPQLTVLIAAYNEAALIKQKIENTLQQNYPAERMRILVVTDGSDDGTPELLQEFPQVQTLHHAVRQGKIAAVQRAMAYVQTPVVVFSDANTFLNPDALRNLARHFSEPQIGAVAGEKRVWSGAKDKAHATGEGLYWKYESWLKKQDAELGTVVGAAGELFAIRAELFESVPADTIIEDFYLTLRIAQKGYRVAYAPDAFAEESASASAGEEIKRKIRISAGGFQAMARLRSLLNPIRYGMLAFQYVSHRVLRWTLAPAALPLLFFTNAAAAPGSGYYTALLVLQTAFYLVAFLGYLTREKPMPVKGVQVPFYFVLMNVSVYLGLVKYLRNQQSAIWEKAQRAEWAQ